MLRKKGCEKPQQPPTSCPECTGVMEEVHKYGAVFSKCKVCGGTWFDKGQLQTYVKWFMQNPSSVPKPVLLFPKKVEASNRWDKSALKCPRCHCELDLFNYAYDSNIMLLRCPECAGVWIDKQKLINVVSYSNFRVLVPKK